MIDVTIPRECVYRRFEDDPGSCPRCGAPLHSHFATYLIATRRGQEIADSFIIGGDIGWFCARCPTMVTNPEDVSEYLQHSLPHWDIGAEFALVGIIDKDAIPEEKQNLPLGSDDNPLPLVEFTKVSTEEGKARDKPPQSSGRSSPVGGRRRVARTRDRGRFEERYEDVLQNIEFGIIEVYRDHPEMTDWHASTAIEALIREYEAEVKPSSLNPLSEQVYDSVKMTCEWRLGREAPFMDEDGKPVDVSPEPITLDEIIACLKRVRKSVEFWTKKGGRQGYLTFVGQYVP